MRLKREGVHDKQAARMLDMTADDFAVMLSQL